MLKNKLHVVSSFVEIDGLDLWPGDIVELRGQRYKMTSDGKLVAC